MTTRAIAARQVPRQDKLHPRALTRCGQAPFPRLQKRGVEAGNHRPRLDPVAFVEWDLSDLPSLWSFVHGLSFLQIDGKLQKAKIPIEMEDTLVEIARRVVEDAMPGAGGAARHR